MKLCVQGNLDDETLNLVQRLELALIKLPLTLFIFKSCFLGIFIVSSPDTVHSVSLS